VDSQPKSVGLADAQRLVCIHQMNQVNSCNSLAVITAL